MAQGSTKGVPIDIDPLLANNSDLLVPSQKAVKTYADTKQAALTLTTTGTVGAATLVGSTLNIPQYANNSNLSVASGTTSLIFNSGNPLTYGTIYIQPRASGNNIQIQLPGTVGTDVFEGMTLSIACRGATSSTYNITIVDYLGNQIIGEGQGVVSITTAGRLLNLKFTNTFWFINI